eukprot:CAMPEP_0198282284 /NCGR_PEP_ID=MMETSP1449-20131203/2131_1 /TAXON_ID=420275 /ORGANISM="Attheya septentrionalis, Strain CCMP2084" /LENGTH=447 /DNA_ID=CAMNT_0043978483 /DNA_START=165 /DNA_END=1508 /DNA_ORIENTATION=+
MRPHRLQRKGVLTAGLIVFADTIAHANAVNFWASFEKWSSHGAGPKNTFSSTFDDFPSFEQSQRATTAATKQCNTQEQSQQQPILSPRSHLLSRRLVPTDCCKECKGCLAMTDSQVYRTCGILRGGAGPPDVAASMLDAVTQAADFHKVVTPYNIPLNGWKVIFQFFLTALNVACWLIPLRSKKISENKLALSIANAFSGGVFLSLAFGHLIPECVHGFTGYNEALPFMIVLGGYLLIFFVEKVAFDAHGALEQMEGGGHHHHGKSMVPNGTGNGAKNLESVDSSSSSDSSTSSGRGAVILLGALAVHSVLEMTALGLASTFGDSALLSISIALHQPAESIALLVAFLKSGMPKSDIVKYLSVFSAMGPLGVAIGMAVSEFASPIVDSIMLAVVAGTFVYVGATEVIPEEWEDQEHKWKKFFALISGIVSIFMITQYTISLEAGHSH